MKSINFYAPCNNFGYGVAGFNILKSLMDSRINVSLWPIGRIDLPYPEANNYIQKAIDFQSSYNVQSPCIRLFHEFDLAEFVGRGKHVGWPVFELDTLNDRSKHHLSCVDEIFVCCQYNKEVIENHQIQKNINVIPLGVDRSIFNESKHNPHEHIFNILHIGKMEHRKGHDFIIKAFSKAFEPSDRVALWMMTDNPFLNKDQKKEWVNIYKKHKMGNKVCMLPRVQTCYEVVDIIGKSDIGFFPARAEGFNLEALEFLSCGKKIICSNWSGHKEYVNNDNAMLLEIDEREPAIDPIWNIFHGQGNWAKLTEDHLDQTIEYLRKSYKEKMEQGNLPINEEGIATAKSMTWDICAKKIIKILEN